MPVRRTGPPEGVTAAVGRVEAGGEARSALTKVPLTASASGTLAYATSVVEYPPFHLTPLTPAAFSCLPRLQHQACGDYSHSRITAL
jgi:hypothetical protein